MKCEKLISNTIMDIAPKKTPEMDNTKMLWTATLLIIWLQIISPSVGETASITSSILQSNPHTTLEEWSTILNEQLLEINQFTAYYAWELSVNPTENLSHESIDFNALKSKWIDVRCDEFSAFSEAFHKNNTIVRMWKILCRGPRFTAAQTKQLSLDLFAMQTTFTETCVCIPQHFDVCMNLDRIWEWTFIRRPDGTMQKMEFGNFRIASPYHSQLYWYPGNVSSEEYYVFGPDENDEFPGEKEIHAALLKGPFICFDGESDLENVMAGNFSCIRREDCALRVNEMTRWAWESWRIAVGIPVGKIFPSAMETMNIGAQANGYRDIGEVWREELEIPNLRTQTANLMDDIKPFYGLLHGVLRNVLWQKVHTFEPFDPHGPIPAHLLGSMWSQNWQVYHELLLPMLPVDADLDANIRHTNWTSRDMVKRADDFYSSLGLPAMTNVFWERSVFERSNEGAQEEKCHGTAANMFQPDDFRMIVCSAQRTIDDLYVIVHEMGHLHYYMAFNTNQPPIFQDANSALQESIGDSIYLAVMAPQHLNRLGLLTDAQLIENPSAHFDSNYLNVVHGADQHKSNADDEIEHFAKYRSSTGANKRAQLALPVNVFDLSLLLRLALSKIPQIPFEYILDVYRWDLFSGDIHMEHANAYLWQLIGQYQGVGTPDRRQRDGGGFFDAGAKFHVADNTPFVRYFLASFVHAQIFRGLCEVTVFGTVNPDHALPMPLHRCDIYGSKRAGKLIKNALKLGASKPWPEVLYVLSGSREIRADALLQYYSPLIEWLDGLVNEYDIPIGW